MKRALVLLPMIVFLAACSGKPSDARMVASIRDYYGDHVYDKPAVQLQVTVFKVEKKAWSVENNSGVWHDEDAWLATVYLRGNCRIPDINHYQQGEAVALDKTETILFTGEDELFGVDEINGQDAQTGGGSPYVCD